MPYELVVTRPFEGRALGSRVSDQTEIDRILAPGHSHNVVRVWINDPPPKPISAPAPKPAASDKD